MKLFKSILEVIVLCLLFLIAFPFRALGLVLHAIVNAFLVGYKEDMNKLLK